METTWIGKRVFAGDGIDGVVFAEVEYLGGGMKFGIRYHDGRERWEDASNVSLARPEGENDDHD